MILQVGPRTVLLAGLATRVALMSTALVTLYATTGSVREAEAADLDGPAVILALDYSGRTVTLLPTDSDPLEACHPGVATVYCGARRIDRLNGVVTALPDFVTISADQSALITIDRRWLDIDTGQSTPVPADVATTNSSLVVISSDGRVYAGSNADRTAGWVVDGASGLAMPLPIAGAPVSVSATGRFVLIGSLSNCVNSFLCDQYLWDRAFGAMVLVADALKQEVASNVASDGSVLVVAGRLPNQTYRLQQIGATPISIALPGSARIDALTDDGSTAILRGSGPNIDSYVVVDLATSTIVTVFTRYRDSGVVSWQLSGDGSTLAAQYGPNFGPGPDHSPKLLFTTLRAPTARVRASEEFAVAVTGVAGVPADASAVMANVTVTDPTADGFVTVWPCGEPRPLASNGNFTAGQTVATATLVRVGASGRVCASSNVDVNLVVDIQGWFGPASPYHSMTPTRLLDSRQGPGSSTGTMTGPVGLALPVAGVATIGADATAVALNVTAVDPPTDGFVTVWPCGQPKPLASSLNVGAGRTAANLVVSAVGTSGSICFASNVDTQIVVDAQGWFGGDSTYRPLNPTRLTDTRAGETDTVGNVSPSFALVVPTRGVASDATAVMLNIAVTNPGSAGWLVAWPCDEDRPIASNINFVTGQTAANAVLAKIDSAGDVCVASNAAIDVVVDITGTFGPESPYHPMTPTRVLDTRS